MIIWSLFPDDNKTSSIPKVQTILDYAFKECSNLDNVSFPSSVSSINHYCFASCSNLHTIVFVNSSSAINFGSKCFSNCPALDSITFGSVIFSSTRFEECTALNTINLSLFSSIDYLRNILKSITINYINYDDFNVNSDFSFFSNYTVLENFTSYGPVILLSLIHI